MQLEHMCRASLTHEGNGHVLCSNRSVGLCNIMFLRTALVTDETAQRGQVWLPQGKGKKVRGRQDSYSSNKFMHDSLFGNADTASVTDTSLAPPPRYKSSAGRSGRCQEVTHDILDERLPRQHDRVTELSCKESHFTAGVQIHVDQGSRDTGLGSCQ